MKFEKLDEKLFKVTADEAISRIEAKEDIKYLVDRKLATFGDLNTRILVEKFKQEGYEVELMDLCLEDDISIGLPMPDVSYLNVGEHALSIPMYYNFLTFKEMAKKGALFSTNSEVAERYGRVGLIEVYFQDKLQDFLTNRNINYFGTPKTLTECMRVLEGWDTNRVPRLKSYVEFANFIHLWSKTNFPGYIADEWLLGEQESKELLNKRGTTNVREAVKFFWSNYLFKKKPLVDTADVEIDVIGREFYRDREPDFILVGEDVFSKEVGEGKGKVVFRSFSTQEELVFSRESDKNQKNLKTAMLVRETFPNTTIIMYENPVGLPNFSMAKLDEVKEGLSEEVAIAAKGLRYVLEQQSTLQNQEEKESDNEVNTLRPILGPLFESLGVSKPTNVKAELQKGYSILVYKVSFENDLGKKFEIIVKTAQLVSENETLKNEFALLQSLPKSIHYSVPEAVNSWGHDGKEQISYIFVDGVLLSNIEITEKDIISVLAAIRALQADLIESRQPAIEEERKKMDINIEYATKLSKFFTSNTGYTPSKDAFKEITDFLNKEESKKSRVFVSDRSPTNWVMTENGKLVVLDLGLVRVGNKQEDWIWFIDNHTFKSALSRDKLIDFYLKNEISQSNVPYEDRKREFHFSAVYLNLLQASFLYRKDRNASYHGFLKAKQSAWYTGVESIIQEVDRISSLYN